MHKRPTTLSHFVRSNWATKCAMKSVQKLKVCLEIFNSPSKQKILFVSGKLLCYINFALAISGTFKASYVVIKRVRKLTCSFLWTWINYKTVVEKWSEWQSVKALVEDKVLGLGLGYKLGVWVGCCKKDVVEKTPEMRGQTVCIWSWRRPVCRLCCVDCANSVWSASPSRRSCSCGDQCTFYSVASKAGWDVFQSTIKALFICFSLIGMKAKSLPSIHFIPVRW